MKKIYSVLLTLGVSITQLTAQSPHFFGVTENGGGDYVGSVFRTDTNGMNFTQVDTFDMVQNGKRPANQELLEVGGRFYGVTQSGGNNGVGVLFEFNPSTSNYSVKHHFDDSSGKYPTCYLLLGNNGKIYGTSSSGGTYNRGTLFEYDISSNVLTRKISFQYSEGSYPNGKMVEASTGIIYGVCLQGGLNNAGTLYKYTISSNTLVKKADFKDTITGKQPAGGLMKASNGRLYGLTKNGGNHSFGTLFEYEIGVDSLRKKADFNNLNGRSPSGNLVQVPSGELYGLTQYGGFTSGLGRGTVFSYNITADTLIKKRTISGTLSVGYYPSGELILDSPGKYLILMRTGGYNNYSGTIAEYNLATNLLSGKVEFDRILNGTSPNGNLAKSSTTGKYYGITSYGGSGDFGVVFEYDKVTDTLYNKHSFSSSINGAIPVKGLIKASNGKLYGMTQKGGNGRGTIFEVDPNTHTLTKKINIDQSIGRYPVGDLLEASNGKLYGVTLAGGLNDYGTLFEYNISTNIITKLKDLHSALIAYPKAGLIQAANGKLYGTSYSGGGYGSLYEYNISTNTLSKRDVFNTGKGKHPYSVLLQASNGKLYGTTTYGGIYNKGSIFEFDIVLDSIKKIKDFNDTNGRRPNGGLFQASNGKFYGMTTNGNSSGSTSNSYGVFYEFDLATKNITVLHNFSRNTSGYGGWGEVMEASNGKLYGISRNSTTNGSKIFEYDMGTSTFTIKSPVYGGTKGGLIELTSLNNATVKEIMKDEKTFKVFPNPTTGKITLDLENENLERIKIWNISGKLIKSMPVFSKTVDVSELENGVYIIQAISDKGMKYSKFIKK